MVRNIITSKLSFYNTESIKNYQLQITDLIMPIEPQNF